MGSEENKLAEEEVNKIRLYVQSEDYGYVQIPSKIVNFTSFDECIDHMIKDDEEAYKRAMAIRSTDSFTFTFYIRKKLSAKRFKKYLISKCLSRDDADFLCYTVGYYKGKVSYHDVYLNTLFLCPFVRYYDVFNYIVTKGEIK